MYTYRTVVFSELRKDHLTLSILKRITILCFFKHHCKANVESNLEKLTFISKASVNLADKTVSIEGDGIELRTSGNHEIIYISSIII